MSEYAFQKIDHITINLDCQKLALKFSGISYPILAQPYYLWDGRNLGSDRMRYSRKYEIIMQGAATG